MKLKTLSLIVMLAIIAPIALVATPTHAQVNVVSIVKVTPSDYVHPGEPITVEVAIGVAGIQYTVELTSCYNTSIVWNEVVRSAPTAGTYTVTLILPKAPLKEIGAPACVNVLVTTPLGGSVNKTIKVAPLITINVTKTPVVEPVPTSTGFVAKHVIINVTGYGLDANATVSGIKFSGPITVTKSVNATANSEGVFSVTIDLVNITGHGLPEGTYEVSIVSSTSYASEQKPASLTIVPQIIISPYSSHGRCEVNGKCELKDIVITGYGFDKESNITKVTFFNTNFSLPYSFEITRVQTDKYGWFNMTGAQLTEHNIYNMTAGMYNITLIERPATQTFSTSATAVNGTYTKLVISPTQTEPVLNTPANITAVYYYRGTWKENITSTRQSYTKTEVLKIDFVEGGHTYEIAANLIFNATTGKSIGIQFVLYNMSVSPPATLFSYVNTSPKYDSSIGAYYADVYFNVTPSVVYSSVKNATYMYHARFYNYTNMIYLQLAKTVFAVDYANLSIYYNNTETGTFKKWYFVYNASAPSASNFTYSAGKLSAEVTFTDASISFDVLFESVPAEQTASLTVEASPLTTKEFTFNNVYYIVRPELIVIEPSVIMPGSTITLAAYGYGPAPNKLTLTLDKKTVLGTVTLGRDGNATFTVQLPKYVTFGAHYIWGRDVYGYEYSLAIIVGSKAYWIKLPISNVNVNTASVEVTAGYKNETLVVCPYPVGFVGTSLTYTVKYGGKCDYLGDKIEVVIAGLSPGDEITVYFGDIKVATATANASGVAVADFTVPTVPEGTYTVKVVTPYGTLVPQFFNGTAFITASAKVKPKIILTALNNESILPVLVGPGLVKVIGTGFPAGVGFEGILINGTDAISTFAANVRLWTTDEHGAVVSTLASSEPAVYIPVLEPGAYKISLVYRVGSTLEVSEAGTVYVINNVSIMLTKASLEVVASKLLSSINSLSKSLTATEKSILSAVSSIGTTISTNVVNTITGINTKLNEILSAVKSLSDIKSDIADIKNTASSLHATASSLQSAVTALQSTIAKVSSNLGSISTSLSSLSSEISSLSSKVSSISSTISAMSSTLASTYSAVTSLSKTVSTMSTSVGSIASKVDTLASTVSSISSTLSTVSSKVDKLSSDVASIASKVSSLSSEISSIKAGVSSISSTVSGLVNKVSSVESKLSTEISSAKGAIQSSLGTVQVLVIVALILALIAAVGSIFGAVQISKKLAG